MRSLALLLGPALLASCGGGGGGALSTQTPVDPPAAPTDFQVIQFQGDTETYHFTWTRSPGAAGYRLYRREALITVIMDGSAENYVFYRNSFSTDGDDEFHIQAFNSAGPSTRSMDDVVQPLDNPAVPDMPAQPMGLLAQPAQFEPNRRVRLRWNIPDDASGFKVYHNGEALATVHYRTDTYVHETAGTNGIDTHDYQLIAFNGGGQSGFSEKVQVTFSPEAVSSIGHQASWVVASLSPPRASDGVQYRTEEFMRSHGTITITRSDSPLIGTEVDLGGLEAIGADRAYQRGYHGQGVTVAVFEYGFATTHVDLTGNLLPGYNTQTTDPADPFFIPTTYFGGTGIAGLIAAEKNGIGIHGVAYGAKVVPYLGSHTATAIANVLEREIPIVQLDGPSFPKVKGKLELATVTLTIDLDIAIGPELLDHPDCDACISLLGTFGEYADMLHDEDAVVVIDTGEQSHNSDLELGFVSGGCEPDGPRPDPDPCSSYHITEIRDHFTILPLENSAFDATIQLATVGINLNSIHSMAALPSFRPEMLGRWVAVSGVGSVGGEYRIAQNGCGSAMHYCMVAPYLLTYSGATENDLDTGDVWVPASVVSGALAVLKSRFPNMPMHALLAILFYTARDLGAPGIDEVFGRGLVDLDHATRASGRISVVLDPSAGTGGARGSSVASTAVSLSPALSGLARNVNAVSVAVSFLDDYYYSIPLSGMFQPPAAYQPDLGQAARDMLAGDPEANLGSGFAAATDAATGELRYVAHAGPQWRLDYERCRDCAAPTWSEYRSSRIAAPFFASGGEAAIGEITLGRGWSAFAAAGFSETLDGLRYRQVGTRWQTDHDADGSWSGLLEFSRSDENDALLGGEYSGALSVGDASTYQARLQGELALGTDWTLAGSYTAAWTDADAHAGSMIAEIGGIRSSGWRAYLEGRSLLKTHDALRIGLASAVVVEDGYMRIRHATVEGEPEFSEEHYLNLNSRYALTDSNFELDQASSIVAQVGYAFDPQPKMRAAFGLEHSRGAGFGNDYAVSFELRWDL